jgi:hypothetical protein
VKVFGRKEELVAVPVLTDSTTIANPLTLAEKFILFLSIIIHMYTGNLKLSYPKL